MRSSEYDVQVHPDPNRLYATGRLRKTVTPHLPPLAEPGAVPSSANSRTNVPGLCRSEQVAMFYITAKACRTLTLAQVLIMAAMNAAGICISSEDAERYSTLVRHEGCLSLSHSQLCSALQS